MNTKTIAIFDFDGTLTRGDSLFPFLKCVVGKRSFYIGLLNLSIVFFKFLLRLIPNYEAKQNVLAYYLAGKPLGELEQTGRRFADRIDQMVNPEVLNKLRWHQTAEHITVLASASLQIYLEPWAKANGFDYVLATNLAVDPNGKVTGHFVGKNCYGPEKLKRVDILIEDRSDYLIYMYGDSKGDRELLEYADISYYKDWQNPVKTVCQFKHSIYSTHFK
ncbi:MAG: HAD-IB family hydrolase [Syntrophomonadaceae bacterium]|nr:HAD-IB family hydrolase [Syntrophomonadaceae bacterium]